MWAAATLTVEVAAIRENYRRLRKQAAGVICAAVVKADAYGLGMRQVAPALVAEGCGTFFVAHLDEGVELRRILGDGPSIIVLHGPLPGSEAEFHRSALLPVLNSLDQLAGWADLAQKREARLPAMIQVDTGMTRFGLPPADVDSLMTDGRNLNSITVRGIMSHLACADDPENDANPAQLKAFLTLRRGFPAAPASLSASSGIFLGKGYHLDLVRPGAALYGVAPQPGRPNPMKAVIGLHAQVVQVFEAAANTPVGYGHTARLAHPARLAIVAAGYADGILRSASNQGAAWFGDIRLPMVGRVSMDSITLDVTHAPLSLRPGTTVQLIGPTHGVDELAAAAGTIGYDILTSLGQRYRRRYIDGSEHVA
jgi:alanine racemase